MPTDVASSAVETFQTTINAPAGGDPRTAASVRVMGQALADQSLWTWRRLQSIIGSFCPIGGYGPVKITGVNAGTDRVTLVGHQLANNDAVRLLPATGGAPPAGLSAGVVYYAIVVDGDTLQFSATSGPGAAVDITGALSGDVYVVKVTDPGLFLPAVGGVSAGRLSTILQTFGFLNGDNTWGSSGSNAFEGDTDFNGNVTFNGIESHNGTINFTAATFAGTENHSGTENHTGSVAFAGAVNADDISVTSGNHYKVSSRSITRMMTTPILDAVNATSFLPGFVTAASGTLWYQPIIVPHGAVITAITAYIDPPTDGVFPGTKPTVQLKKINLATASSTNVTGAISDGTTPVASYEANHGFGPSGLSETVDRTTNVYWAEIAAEAGLNATTITIRGCSVTYTVTEIDEGQ